jgi:hypothetical protein
MDTPSASDYLEVKKRKEYPVRNPERNASAYVANKQYLVLQTTASVDSDYRLEPSERFQIPLPRKDLATLSFPPKKLSPCFHFVQTKHKNETTNIEQPFQYPFPCPH